MPDLSHISTRELLAMRNYTFGPHEYFVEDWGFTPDDLYKELNKREHVPNKQEARKARQERAKQKYRRSKNR